MQEERIDWPNGAKIALSIVVNVEEGSEMTVARGDRGMEPVDELGIHIKSPIRNYGNESNYLYGIKAGAPRIVKLLRAHDIRASWTVAALSLENHPEIAAAIRELGHEPVSHGYRWVHQFKMDEAAERDFIDKAVKSIEATTGTRPYGWLSRYFHTDNTRRLLIEAGFDYHMDDYSGDVPFWDRTTVPGRPIAIVPYQLDDNDMKMWTDPAYTPAAWLDYAKACFDQLYREGVEGNPKMMSLGLHLRIIGRPGRIWAFEQLLKHVRAHDGVWVATRHEIARHLAMVDPGMTLRLETSGAVAHLIIDRAAKRNAITQAMWEQFPVLIEQAMADDAVRVMILRAAEPGAFSAGADIAEFGNGATDPAWRAANQAAISRAQIDLTLAPKPVIAFVEGDCVGGGCGLALACDLRVATSAARFGITPAKLGLVYSLHDTKLLVDVVGPSQAKRILFTAGLIDAGEALRIGLVDMLDADPVALAETIAANSPHTARQAKTMVRRILNGQSADDAETEALFADAFTMPDFEEGVAAFLAKRKPVFR